MKTIIAITGGIGSGKSVVSDVLRCMGYCVYDSDREAKRLMNSSATLKTKITDTFGDESYVNGELNRAHLAKIVFGNDEARLRLNQIVHPEVIADFRRFCASIDSEVVFLETAILGESGMDKEVDDVWVVTAPEEMRIQRVISRDNTSVDAVRRRIEAQSNFVKSRKTITNDGETAILPQITRLLNGMRPEDKGTMC